MSIRPYVMTYNADGCRGERMDVLEGLARVHVPAPGGGQMEAALYVRLRPCDPAPSPDDLDYEQKMAELALKPADVWPQPPPTVEYKASHVLRVSTPRFIRRPYTPPEPVDVDTSLPEHEVQEGPLPAESGGANVRPVAGGALPAQKPEKKEVKNAGGGRHASATTLPKEAWTESVAEVEAGDSTARGGRVECGPDDELLIILDAARFLPDNVSVSCARLALLNVDGSPVRLTSSSARDAFGVPNAVAQGVANLESSLHSPTYQLSCSFRVRDCKPSAWVVVRIDALDLQQPAGSPPVCVGLGCLQLFENTATRRPYTEEEGEQFLAAIREAQDTARKHELDEEEAAKLLPRLSVLQGGWQIPLRSTWPLRALWGPGAPGAGTAEKRGRRKGAAAEADPGALTSLATFVGKDVLARARAAAQGEQKGSKAKSLQAGAGTAPSESLQQQLALGLVVGAGGDEDVTARLDCIGPHLAQELPRLPCASLLVRVLVNPSAEDMMAVLAHAGHVGLLNEIEHRQRDLAANLRRPPAASKSDEEEEELQREEELMRSAIVRTKPVYSLGLYNSQVSKP